MWQPMGWSGAIELACVGAVCLVEKCLESIISVRLLNWADIRWPLPFFDSTMRYKIRIMFSIRTQFRMNHPVYSYVSVAMTFWFIGQILIKVVSNVIYVWNIFLPYTPIVIIWVFLSNSDIKQWLYILRYCFTHTMGIWVIVPRSLVSVKSKLVQTATLLISILRCLVRFSAGTPTIMPKFL
jgi:hypothetical protein